MTQSSFKLTVERRFDYMCRLVLINGKKNYHKKMFNLSKYEINFTDGGDYFENQVSMSDNYLSDLFRIDSIGLNIAIENDKLWNAFEGLEQENLQIVVLYYYLGFNDSEIGYILKMKRLTVNRRRNKSLSLIKKHMEEKENEK